MGFAKQFMNCLPASESMLLTESFGGYAADIQLGVYAADVQPRRLNAS
jgi:hypothetical protein|nr:hypothetical protein [uncultured Prevotella sp.]